MSEKKQIDLEKEIDDLEEIDDVEEFDDDDSEDIIIFESKEFGRTYFFESDGTDYTEEELEERVRKLELEKKKKKKKTWTYIGLFVLFIVVISLIDGYLDNELVENGKPMEAPVIDRYYEKENIIFTQPTLAILVEGRLEKVWVKQEAWDKALDDTKVRIVIDKDGEIKLDPRYDEEDVVIESK